MNRAISIITRNSVDKCIEMCGAHDACRQTLRLFVGNSPALAGSIPQQTSG